MKIFTNIEIKIFRSALFCIALLFYHPGAALAQPDTVHMRLAVPVHVFDEITRKDAKLALDMWVREITMKNISKYQMYFDISSSLLENDYEKIDFSDRSGYDILILSMLDYMQKNTKKYWEPVVLTGREGHFPEEYVLLTRREDNLNSFRELKGKHIIIAKKIDEPLILFWLNYEFEKQKLGDPNSYFGNFESFKKDSKAIFSVFFKKADACIVGYSSYQTVVQLNPQIGKTLYICQESPPFPRGMVCLKKSMDQRYKNIIIEALLELPKSQRGKQILAFFGQTLMIPFSETYLEPIRQLFNPQPGK